METKGKSGSVVFTEEMLADSQDVFPIEFLDIQSHRRVLFGEDPFLNLKISTADFRHQLEYELRGKLMQLRSLFLETEGEDARIRELLARSLSSVHVMFRATLRMMGEKAPDHKLELWKELRSHVPLDVEALEEIFLFREGVNKINSPAEDLFFRFVQSIEAVVLFVDQYQGALMKKEILIGVAIVGGLILLIGGSIVSTKNSIVTADEAVTASWAQVENVMQRRSDLIPNLVNTVKGYAKQEKDIFIQVAEARAKLAGAKTIPDKIAANQQIESTLSRLLVIVEQYPALKSNQNFLALQDELTGTENRIAVERMRYNQSGSRLQRHDSPLSRQPGGRIL